ncbi:MAG TPA: PA2169 family four-helix-bundle protein [Vicinamibacterales bacterium]
MAERTERAVLNSLIVACRDADRGFTFASEHVLDSTLRTFFEDLAKERRQYAEALLPHAQRLGGAGDAEGSSLATLHRAWMALKDRVAHQDQAMVVEAEWGERTALAAYGEALDGMLPPEARAVVESQHAGIQAGLKRLHALAIAAA